MIRGTAKPIKGWNEEEKRGQITERKKSGAIKGFGKDRHQSKCSSIQSE